MRGRVTTAFCWALVALAIYCLLALRAQPVAVAFGVIALAAALYWYALLAVLLPLYRGGKLTGWTRPAAVLVVALLTWLTLMIPIYIVFGSSAGAALLSVLWMIGLLSWGAVASVNHLRSQGPRVGPLHAQAEAAPRQWKVRKAPQRAAPLRPGYAGASPTVQAIESMEVQW